MRMCFRVHMHAYTYVCRYIYMYIFFAVSVTYTLQVLWALVHGPGCVCYTGVVLHQRTHRRHTRCRLCTYVYMYIGVYMHLYAYGCVCASMILLDTLRLVTKIFDLYIRVSACSWLGRGRDRRFVLYISLFLRVLGWWVCVCLYARVHTHNLLGYLM